ncbi:MAG: porin family protein [Gammaproteobacteria bacterium]|nr:porin family protein [Gammaproteobacteria bacterium]
MKKILIIATTLAIIAPMAANADGPSYNDLYLGYSKSSIEGYSGGKGYTFGGSYEFYPNWFFAVDYGHNSYNGGFQTGGFFTQDYTLAVGAHMPITDSADLVGRFGYANDHWKQGPSTNLFPGFTVATSETKTGYDLGVGIRAMVLDQLELNAFLDHNNAGLLSHDHNNSETTGSVGSVYNFTDQFALGLSYTRSNQLSSSNWMLTGRWYFQGVSQ